MSIEPYFDTLGAMLSAHAKAAPDKTALVCGTRRQSYEALDVASNRLANQLRATAPGHEVIGIIGKNSDFYVEIMFGIVKSGSMALTLNWRLAVPELRAILVDSTAQILFYEVEFAETVAALKALLPFPLQAIPFNGAAAQPTAYEEFRDQGPGTPPAVDIVSGANAILMYTSGTTGLPKGVAATHFALLAGVHQGVLAGQSCAAVATDITVLTTPLFHLAAHGTTLGSIYAGATLIILNNIDIPRITAAIAEHRVTRAVVLPALMPGLLEATTAGLDLSSLRFIGYGASPIPESLLARMLATFSCGFGQTYGMTEISTAATYLAPEEHFPGSATLRSCGRPFHGVELRIAGGAGQDCPPGEIGEILLRSPTLFKGYWRRPDATAEAMRDGWYLTGDMGYLDPQGFLYLMDRKKDMIISGGENIYPAEIESAISAYPDVVRAAVIGVPSEKWGEEVKAIVVLCPGAMPDPTALLSFLRDRIAGYKIPKTIDFVEELPLTAVGKVAKPILREKYWAGYQRRIN